MLFVVTDCGVSSAVVAVKWMVAIEEINPCSRRRQSHITNV